MRFIPFFIWMMTCAASARPVPEWLAGHEILLPEVSDESIEILRQAQPHSPIGEISKEDAPLPPKAAAAIKAIANLNHEASKAMIWLYVEDPPRPQYQDWRMQRKKGEYIRSLNRDTDAARWLVPILRKRLDWTEPRIANKTLDQTWFSASELGAIEGVLAIHGTDDDLRRVYKVLEEFRASPWGNTLYPILETPEQRWRNAMSRRQTYLRQAAPYCDEFRRMISMPLLGLQAAPPQPGNGSATSAPATVEGDAKLSAAPASLPLQTSAPSQSPWLITALVCAGAGLLWLLLRKKSS